MSVYCKEFSFRKVGYDNFKIVTIATRGRFFLWFCQLSNHLKKLSLIGNSLTFDVLDKCHVKLKKQTLAESE